MLQISHKAKEGCQVEFSAIWILCIFCGRICLNTLKELFHTSDMVDIDFEKKLALGEDPVELVHMPV